LRDRADVGASDGTQTNSNCLLVHPRDFYDGEASPAYVPVQIAVATAHGLIDSIKCDGDASMSCPGGPSARSGDDFDDEGGGYFSDASECSADASNATDLCARETTETIDGTAAVAPEFGVREDLSTLRSDAPSEPAALSWPGQSSPAVSQPVNLTSHDAAAKGPDTATTPSNWPASGAEACGSIGEEAGWWQNSAFQSVDVDYVDVHVVPAALRHVLCQLKVDVCGPEGGPRRAHVLEKEYSKATRAKLHGTELLLMRQPIVVAVQHQYGDALFAKLQERFPTVRRVFPQVYGLHALVLPCHKESELSAAIERACGLFMAVARR
jgi:hypothetical protein